MGAHFQYSHKLLALAVFVDPLKTGYVRSVGLHEQSVGCLRALQQDFLLDPGKYKSVTRSVMLGSFRTLLSSVGLKQSMDTIFNMQQNEGWHCMLEYRSDLPSETLMPWVLTPSKNPDLKDIPSLEQDLKAVESAVLACNGSVTASGPSLVVDGKSTTTTPKDSLMWPSSHLTLSCPSGVSFLEHPSDRIPGLETPERILNSQQIDVLQNWGSELELASPKASLTRASFLDAGHNEGSLWNPTMMLDLNLDLSKFPTQEEDPDCALVLSTPISDPKPLLSFEPEMQSLGLQQSSFIDTSTDFSILESFVNSHSSYKNVGVNTNTTIVKSDAKQNPNSLCSEDSVGCYGSVINMSSSDANANSSTTSSAVYSAHDENTYGSMNTKLNGISSITSSYMCSSGHYKYVVKGHGKQSLTRAWRSGSRQTLWQCGRNVVALKNKPRIVRPGSTSERITEITLHELSQYFSMPINQAAKELNVGLTVLKKRCREFKISRWPHRKMKSLNSLIGNIQDLAEDQGVKSSVRLLNTVRELEEQKRLMEEMPGVELAEKTKKLRQACFKANYKKRRLGTVTNKNDVQGVLLAMSPLSSPVSHPLGILDLNPTFSVSPPRSCLTMDHFL